MTTDHCDSCLHDGAHGSMDGKQTNTHTRTTYINKIKSALSFFTFERMKVLRPQIKVHNGKNIYFNHHTGLSKHF